MSSTVAAPAPVRAPAPPQIQELRDRTLQISDDAERQKGLLLAAVVIALLLIVTGVFAIFRSRKGAPSLQQTVAPTIAAAAPATIAPTTTQPASSGVVEAEKIEQKKASASPAHNAKASAQSHNGSPEQEVSIREIAPKSTASDAPPDAPSIGQLSNRSSADIAAQIIAANTPAPELTPLQSRGVVEGKLIKKVLPRYPEMARRAGVGGDVNLVATIGTDGKLKNIKVVNGSPLLREEAIAAARQWRYSPYLLGGKPVETDTHITISFKH
jgi:TonB family protein